MALGGMAESQATSLQNQQRQQQQLAAEAVNRKRDAAAAAAAAEPVVNDAAVAAPAVLAAATAGDLQQRLPAKRPPTSSATGIVPTDDAPSSPEDMAAAAIMMACASDGHNSDNDATVEDARSDAGADDTVSASSPPSSYFHQKINNTPILSSSAGVIAARGVPHPYDNAVEYRDLPEAISPRPAADCYCDCVGVKSTTYELRRTNGGEGRIDAVSVPHIVYNGTRLPTRDLTYELLVYRGGGNEVFTVVRAGPCRIELPRPPTGQHRQRSIARWRIVVPTERGDMAFRSEPFLLMARAFAQRVAREAGRNLRPYEHELANVHHFVNTGTAKTNFYALRMHQEWIAPCDLPQVSTAASGMSMDSGVPNGSSVGNGGLLSATQLVGRLPRGSNGNAGAGARRSAGAVVVGGNAAAVVRQQMAVRRPHSAPEAAVAAAPHGEEEAASALMALGSKVGDVTAFAAPRGTLGQTFAAHLATDTAVVANMAPTMATGPTTTTGAAALQGSPLHAFPVSADYLMGAAAAAAMYYRNGYPPYPFGYPAPPMMPMFGVPLTTMGAATTSSAAAAVAAATAAPAMTDVPLVPASPQQPATVST